MRIDKFLSNQGIGSRTEAKQYIKKGLVTVNGEICKKPETQINENTDKIICNGKEVRYERFRYYMLNKPAGYVSATNDNLHSTVIDLLKGSVNTAGLFPVGRLDIDTEGLLIITNDGKLSHELLSPGKHVGKTYYAKINGYVTESNILDFKNGIDIGDDKPTLPAKLIIKDADITAGTSEIFLTITEGRFHQVKRSFAALGMEVIYLKRISMGALNLDESLPSGSFRELSPEEVMLLRGGAPV